MRAVAVCAAAVLALALVGSAAPKTVPHWKAWLCFPGSSTDWCSVDQTTDVFTANEVHKTVPFSVADNPAIDCFYLYPTVSEQHRENSDLKVHPEERETAITQASRFSHVCRVYAPLYRQVTAYGYGNPYHGNFSYEYTDALAAWRDYMAHYNGGRGVVLIGHSEGSFLFERLIAEQIEPYPAVRKLLVSAILLGGNVVVADGSTTGGDFKHVPICTSATETGCVVAYSSWSHTPPKNAAFQSAKPGHHVVCVNPAAPGSTAAVPIDTVFAGINPQGIVPYGSKYVTYHWIEFPDLYTAQCVQQGKRAWLLVSRIKRPGDKRPTVYQALGPDVGLHPADMNIALGNLVALVGSQSRAWRH